MVAMSMNSPVYTAKQSFMHSVICAPTSFQVSLSDVRSFG
jgi:hypothetical protein